MRCGGQRAAHFTAGGLRPRQRGDVRAWSTGAHSASAWCRPPAPEVPTSPKAPQGEACPDPTLPLPRPSVTPTAGRPRPGSELPAPSPAAARRPQNHWPEAVWLPPGSFVVETSMKRSQSTVGGVRGAAGVSEGEGCAVCADVWFLVGSWAGLRRGLPQALTGFATGRLGCI